MRRSRLALILFVPSLIALSAATPAPAETPCVDEVQAYLSDADVVVDHFGAWYNCCPEMRYDVEVGEGVVRVVEVEVIGLCDCYCCFDMHTTVEGLAPGDWRVDFVWLDDVSEAWETLSFFLSVPDLGQAVDPRGGAPLRGPCYDPSTGIHDRAPTWGTVKAIFE